jgi:hypothetical protein
MMSSALTHPNLFLKVSHQDDASFCSVCHRRCHGILPKEYSGTFYEVPWGTNKKKMFTNKKGSVSSQYLHLKYSTSLQTDIFLHKGTYDHYLCKGT